MVDHVDVGAAHHGAGTEAASGVAALGGAHGVGGALVQHGHQPPGLALAQPVGVRLHAGAPGLVAELLVGALEATAVLGGHHERGSEAGLVGVVVPPDGARVGEAAGREPGVGPAVLVPLDLDQLHASRDAQALDGLGLVGALPVDVGGAGGVLVATTATLVAVASSAAVVSLGHGVLLRGCGRNALGGEMGNPAGLAEPPRTEIPIHHIHI